MDSPSLRRPAAPAPFDRDDGMVFLPHASPFVEGFCVCLYVALAVVAATRALSVAAPVSAAMRRQPDAIKRQQTFQRLMIVFAVMRAVCFVTRGLLRGLLNRLALCLFFSLVLFQVLFWIDIANPKLSTRSRRIWNAFILSNALFYTVVLGLVVLREREFAGEGAAAWTAEEHLEHARGWDLVPVLLIALGSLAASLGLLYSTCKTRRRVGRVLKQFAEQSLPKRLNDRVEAKLQRALRVTNVIMGICSVVFLMRTILYLQRPFSHSECGAIRDPNACILIGYGIPELVPCTLFLVLMWEVEPHLELPSRRKSSINVAAVARVAETTPLLLDARRRSSDLSVDVSVPSRRGSRIQRPSPLSSALGGNVIAAARRRLRRVLEESFGMRSEDENSNVSSGGPTAMSAPTAAENPAVKRELSGVSIDSPRLSRSSSDRRDQAALSPVAGSRSRESSGSMKAESELQSPSTFVWMSFQCFRLTLPSTTEPAVVLVLHHINPRTGEVSSEIGRTEVAYSSDPSFHVMLPVEVREAHTLRATVYAVTRPKMLHDLESQWLIGDTLVPLDAYVSMVEGKRVVIPGVASVHELQSPLSKTYASGELVARCEAPLLNGDSLVDSERSQRITRAFVYQPATTLTGNATPKPPQIVARSKLLVEEELIESVYTWEMPYQLLQLILADLLVQLDILKHALAEEESANTSAPPAGRTTIDRQTSGSFTARTKSTPSVGMLSEMIMQIQGDALERKSKKWGEELVVKMEKYIDDVEAAILRYESANHGGLTFKPSTMKADSGLSFLALNLHQQLVSVGNAVTASISDVADDGDGDSRTDAEHYIKLIDSSVSVVETSSPSLRILEVEHGSKRMFGDSASEEEDGELRALFEDDQQVEADGDDAFRSQTPEPFEALRRRVISFDSAENIVNLQTYGPGSSRRGAPLSREQRALAESIVALGIENVFEAEGTSEAEEEPDVMGHSPPSGNVSSVAQPPLRRMTMTAMRKEPFEDHVMYGTTTVGAFAAHVYGFRKGGIRQLRAELEKLGDRMARESERAASELTVEGLEREYVELKWHIDRRLEVTFCQAMSALATCFQQTLYVHLHERGCGLGQRAPTVERVRGLQYLEQLSEVGFVFSVESLLSTYSKEAGMLGDMEAAVRELERVRIKLRPVQSPRAAQFRVSVTSGQQGLTMELPLIVASAEQYPSRTMHRVLGQDASTGAVFISLETADEWARARRVFRQTIAVVPLIFSQGMNEMQTVANTVGKDTLQREINAENLVILERQTDAFVAWWQANMPQTQREGSPSVPERVTALRRQLRDHIQRAGRGKDMDILTLSSSLARLMGGGRVTCCKSAKDRTAMSVTLEEASLLVQAHGLRSSERELFTALLRTYGVRRENARKNIGSAQYCFSALQNYMLPTDYQCPPGTGGGSSALS